MRCSSSKLAANRQELQEHEQEVGEPRTAAMFPLCCIYTGYTLQHGNSVLYRNKTGCVNKLAYSKSLHLSDSDPARTQTSFLFSPPSRPCRQYELIIHKTDTENPYGTTVQLYP